MGEGELTPASATPAASHRRHHHGHHRSSVGSACSTDPATPEDPSGHRRHHRHRSGHRRHRDHAKPAGTPELIPADTVPAAQQCALGAEEMAAWPAAVGVAVAFLGGCLGHRLGAPGAGGRVAAPAGPAAAPQAADAAPAPSHAQDAKRRSVVCGAPTEEEEDKSGAEEDEGEWDDAAEERALEESVMAGLALEDDGAAGRGRKEALTTTDIVREQQRVVRAVCEVLSVDAATGAAMLRRYRWRKDDLLAAFLESPDRVLREAGASPKAPLQHSAPAAPMRAAGPVACSVCGETVAPEDASAMQCAHWFCNACWREYLALKIGEGQCFVTCPAHKCAVAVDQETVQRLVGPELYARYVSFVTKSFVDDNPEVKWCPAPGCGNALKAEQCIRGVGHCTCGHRFCWHCAEEAHAPATCAEVLSWKKKCLDDSETVHWILTNTQTCPKCRSSIEKNGGCNHMTCRKCKHEFCWVCHGDWKGHTNFYSCNRYEAEVKKKHDKPRKSKKSQKEREQQINESKAALEKYLHYYHRYANHERSSRFEAQQREASRQRMRELRETDSAYQDVSFIMDATEVLLMCRRALKYSYVHAYYLEEGTARNLFEMQQSDLESTTERLSELLEQPAEKVSRADTKHATAICSARLANMVEDFDHHDGPSASSSHP